MSAEPGAFRSEAYAAPTSSAFNPTPPPPVTAAVPAATPGEASKLRDDKDEQSTQHLIDEFRTKSKAGRVVGILPVGVDFPAFGPSTYLVSELTTEGQFPAADLNYQRDKKAGAR